MTTPNKENIRLWVDALRSGEFEQGESVLKDPEEGTYCCLGVACVVAGTPVHTEDAGLGDDYRRVWFGTPGHANYQVLPDDVMEWLGLEDPDPYLLKTDEDATGEWPDRISCTDANDNFGWDFDQIADAIERTYLT